MVGAAAIVAGGFTTLVGLAIGILGWAAVEAGRGGYGHGPFPMLPVPRDNFLIGAGLLMVAIGSGLMVAGLNVLGVFP